MADGIINRTGAEALVPEEFAKEIIQGAISNSVVLSKFRRLANMSSKVQSIPVLEMLPSAYFIDSDTGFGKTTKMQWERKKIVAMPMMTLVPIPNDLLDDMESEGYDFQSEVLPRINEAMAKVIDKAIIWGDGKPAEWRTGLVETIINSGNAVASTGDLYADLMGVNGLMAKVEANGFSPNGCVASVKFRSELRGLVDTTGRPIFHSDPHTAGNYDIDGCATYFANNGTWDDSVAKIIAGDFTYGVYAFRKDITIRLATDGVISDPETGKVIYNLTQQNMSALIVTCRLGWELPNPINSENSDETTRLPFALLSPATISSGYKVTFTVTDSDSATVENATVDLAGAKIKTNASGVAEFTNIPDGVYVYAVKLSGYVTATGRVTISAGEASVAVTLAAKS